MSVVWSWLGRGLRESLAMVWLTWWPLVLGFSLSGLVQSIVARDGLRSSLGRTTPKTVVRASLLGTVSSSCSYAASGMARSLFGRGASWTNSLVFMVASTNLVIEMGVVIIALLGVDFLVAQLLGGLLMIAILSVSTGFVFTTSRQGALASQLREPVATDGNLAPWRSRVIDVTTYQNAARYTLADITMLRKELVGGFLVAGFLAVDVSTNFWRTFLVSGHGVWTTLENAVVAPLIAVASCVCSVGNVPLAAALWSQGLSFGAVVSFLFADLIALPLLFIYVHLYGRPAAWRLFILLWATMSVTGLLVQSLFSAFGEVPTHRVLALHQGEFPLGWTLVLNVVATAVLASVLLLSRRTTLASHLAIDPVCSMQVEKASAPATRELNDQTFYFCSPHCAEKFSGASRVATSNREVAVDPVCAMTVEISPASVSLGEGENTVYFCGEGCRDRFQREHTSTASTILVTPKDVHE